MAATTAPPAFRIGICLSGGGYRAAAYHLGVLSYLNRCQLLSNLHGLSTVSGGTIVGAKYIQSLVEGQSFVQFFSGFYEFLSGKSLLQRCFEKLGETSPNIPSRRANAIVALANAYQDALFHRCDGSPFLFKHFVSADIPVPEVFFNATELRTGLPFRFRLSPNSELSQGNSTISFQAKDCELMRIADIVAASSCFPGGFEPFAFPDDCCWPNGVIPTGLRGPINNELQAKPLPLMDGGIGDNQGIDALLEATDSWRAIDFLVVSDSDRASDDLYPFPSMSRCGLVGHLTLGVIRRLSDIFTGACALTIIVIGLHAWSQVQRGRFVFFWDFFVYVVPLIVTVIAYLGLRNARHIIRDEMLAQIPGLGRKAWIYLRNLQLRDFLYMLRLRHTSLSVITNSVFMNRIRQLIYRVIDNDLPVLRKTLKCRIYDLASTSCPIPSCELLDVVRRAAETPTTIWFDEAEQLPSLVTCGQATVCFKLLCFLRETYGSDASQYGQDVRELCELLELDWASFLKQPHFLIKLLIE